MKRLLIVGVIVMVSVFCSGNGFFATYDATGTWDSNNVPLKRRLQ